MKSGIKRIKLRGLNNTRDLGDIPFSCGGIARGKLIRSGSLFRIPSSTVKKLEALNVKTVIDLRTEQEAAEKPDNLPVGAKYVRLSLLNSPALGVTFEKNEDAGKSIKELGNEILSKYGSADEYMEKVYDDILFDSKSQENLSAALKIIIDAEGCVLFHCTGGKDRAGVLAMLIECLLGVDEKTVLLDYAATGEFQKHRNRLFRMFSVFMPFSRKVNKMLLEFLKTNVKHIERVLSKIKDSYGSVTEYCKSALGITDGEIEKMRHKYLKRYVEEVNYDG